MPANRVSKKDHYSHPHASHGGRDWFADSFVGQIIYRSFKPKWYPEEQDDFVIPERYRKAGEKSQRPERTESRSSASTLVEEENNDQDQRSSDIENQGENQQQGKEKKKEKKPEEEDPNIVTWYSENDAANPQNWSLFKKCVITGQLCLLTFSIYIGSAIYSPGYMSLQQTFPGINQTLATLGLTLFVIGYAIGPLFLAAPSEIPQIGRTPIYMITLFLFVILQIPSALATNFAGLMVLRFLSGFIGSPVLATGGASLGDVFPPKTRPYAIGIWGLAAIQGPVLGPLLGGFAIQAKTWRWAFWILLMLDGFCFIVLSFTMAETSSANILTRRAQRLRKLTGNDFEKSS